MIGTMTRKKRRLVLIGAALGVLGLAAALILVALREQIVFFYSPAELAQKLPKLGVRLRIGGLVKEGSFSKATDRAAHFIVTDRVAEISVTYQGILPDLLREGQGVVAEGVLESNGIFKADQVLAKHDEQYMPREVADALKKQGVWQNGKPK